MHATRSKLSPWPYLRNNRVRSAVLIICLAMFMVMIYVMNYIIGGTIEPFEKCDVENFDRLRVISPDLGLNYEEYDSDEAFLTEAWRRAVICGQKLEEHEDVISAVPFAWQATTLNSFIGMYGVRCYLFLNSTDCEKYYSHMEAKLISGRMPEKPGEILIDKKLKDNHKNDNTLLQLMGSDYQVVGIVSADYYLAFGIALEAENDVNILAMTRPGSDVDLREVIKEKGYDYTYYLDQAKANVNLVDSMGGSLDTVQSIMTGVSGTLLLICVVVVLSLHIMDRHNEWCLLNSIGFKTSEIYLMALKEILICVFFALTVGAVLCFGACYLLELLLYNPIGITIRIFRPAAFPRILMVMAALIGIVQIPLFSGMRKIQTIDAIE